MNSLLISDVVGTVHIRCRGAHLRRYSQRYEMVLIHSDRPHADGCAGFGSFLDLLWSEVRVILEGLHLEEVETNGWYKGSRYFYLEQLASISTRGRESTVRPPLKQHFAYIVLALLVNA